MEIISNIKYSMLSRILVLGFAFILNIILIRALPVEEYGLYSLILAFVATVETICDIGLGEATKFFVAEKKYKIKEYFSVGVISLFVISLFFAGLNFVFSGLLGKVYSINGIYFVFASVFIVIAVLRSSFFQILEGLSLFKFKSFILLLHVFLRYFTVLFIILGFKGIGGIFGEFLSQFLVLALILIFLRRFFRLFFDFSILRQLFSYGKNILFSTIVLALMSNIHALVLGFFSISDVGVFSAAIKVSIPVTVIPLSLMSVLFPFFVSNLSNRKVLSNYVSKYLRYSLIPTILITAIIITFSTQLTYLLYGKDFGEFSSVLSIVILGVGFDVIFSSLGSFLNAVNKPNLSSRSIIFKAVITIVSAIILIPLFNLSGATISLFLGLTIGNLVTIFYSKQFSDWHLPIIVIFKCLISVFITVIIILLLVQFTSGLLSVVIGLLVSPVYFMLLLLFREFDKKDFYYFKRFLGIK